MRLSMFALGLAASNFTHFCDDSKSDEPSTANATTPAAEPAAKASATAAARGEARAGFRAEFGGNLLSIGDHVAELRIHRAGLIEARVRDAQGAAVTPNSVELAATAAVKGRDRKQMKLSWSEPHACFRGEAGANAELEPEAVDVELRVDGSTRKGALTQYALLFDPEFGGQTLSAGKYGAEVLVGADGSVRAKIREGATASIDSKATVEARLPTASGKAELVALAYAPAGAVFVGRANSDVKLAPGPLELSVTVGGDANVGALAAIALVAKAEHGGQLVALGDYSVELVVEPGDVVAAYAFDASGATHAKGDLDVSLALSGKTDHDVKLVWHPPTASYRAKLDADLDLAMKPVRVALRAGGKLHMGGCAALKVDAKAKASSKLAANATGAVKAPNVKAQLAADKSATASAKAAVTPPKVSVKKSASASAGGDGKSGAKASAKAGFSFGLK